MTAPGGDSFIEGVTTIAKSRTGKTLFAAAWPYLVGLLFGMCTAVMGWAGGKLDTKAELQAAIELRREDADRKKLEEQRHQQLVARFDDLDDKLFSEDVRKPGRITRIEKDQYWAWRAATETKALALGGEPGGMRARKQSAGERFTHSFDMRTQKQPPAVVYDELFAQVAVP